MRATGELRFAGCRLDLDARRLFRGARDVHLTPKAFALLQALIENRPRALSKTELLERVWPGVFVSEVSLARAVSEIRDGVGDPARSSRIIRTVHGYGYAFDADVENETPPRPRRRSRQRVTCWLTDGDREFPLADGDQVAGRDADVPIRLDSAKVSRRHARFLVDGGSVTVEDLDSKNGTFVRGARVAGRVVLKSGDGVRIGPFAFTVRVEVASFSTETDVSGSASSGPASGSRS